MAVFTISASFVLGMTLFFFARRWVRGTKLMDQSGGRKTHGEAVPLICGLVIVPLFIIGLLITGYENDMWALMAALVVLLTMGALDDAFHLNPYLKFAVQLLLACFVVIFGELQIATLGNLLGFGDVPLMIFSKPFTIMCLVLLMNAMNMLDGNDGLAGGLTFVMLLAMLVAAVLGGGADQAVMIGLMLAPLAAFLIYNMRYPGHARASVFMGDAGSLSMGLILGWFAITLTQYPVSLMDPVTIPWLFAIPVADALCLYVMRAAKGQKPFEADRNHIHHRFVDNGVSPGRTTAVILTVKAIFAGGAIALSMVGVPSVLLFLAWLGVFFIHMYLVFHPQRYAYLTRAFA